jgi:CRISPR-associated endonuclease/helicase Cas3
MLQLIGKDFLAHVCSMDKERKQSVAEHLLGVATITMRFTDRIDMPLLGELLGLAHDIGKYSQAFQSYLASSVGLSDQDNDDIVEKINGPRRGDVDHSSAGAQFVFRRLGGHGRIGRLAAELAALSLASHHSSLIDALGPDGRPVFADRMDKADQKTHLDEVTQATEPSITRRIEEILNDPAFLDEVCEAEAFIEQDETDDRLRAFRRGLLLRFVFSCLLDADRIDSADFEHPEAASCRSDHAYKDWGKLTSRLEAHLASLESQSPISRIRAEISNTCFQAGGRPKGVYTLTVPTGGGKTLASLRFALAHARNSGSRVERVIYCVPFTSIIEQNAATVRRILEIGEEEGSVVLEHHSNLLPEHETWLGKLLSENWDAPVVFTTNVQVLEAMYGSGTRSARRFHRLANAILIFDEIQAIPISCVHLFNNAINFLAERCGSTVVLCSATQPLLEKVDQKRGAIRLSQPSEIISNCDDLFLRLRRVEIIDRRKERRWTFADAAELAVKEQAEAGSVLVVVNTKRAARETYTVLEGLLPESVPRFHLSTAMCPAHRRTVLDEIRTLLANDLPVACVSTQLIEAGVDVDFGAVIRSFAGLDSIAQAAGRCNRNGRRPIGRVSVIELADEQVASLVDIRKGQEAAQRVFEDYEADPRSYDDDLLSPKAIEWYFTVYLFGRENDLAYNLGSKSRAGRSTTLLELLSDNKGAELEFSRTQQDSARRPIYFQQSFSTAAKEFAAIDNATEAVLVPWTDGLRLSGILNSDAAFEEKRLALKEAQAYSVALRPSQMQGLLHAGELHQIETLGLYELINSRYYSEDFGLSNLPVGHLGFLDA